MCICLLLCVCVCILCFAIDNLDGNEYVCVCAFGLELNTNYNTQSHCVTCGSKKPLIYGILLTILQLRRRS